VSVEEQAAIAGVREKYTFRAAIHPGTALWTSEGSTAWTVILDPDPVFTLSCLNRTVYVKPLPEDFAGALRKVAGHLSTVGIHPATSAHAERIAPLGVSRICPIGAMQRPPLSWHQDGEPVLLPLVRWIDFEPGEPDNSVS